MTLIPNSVSVNNSLSTQEMSLDGSEKSYNINADMELVNLVVAGDVIAFETLYNKYHRRVFSLCLRMLQNTSSAEDLTQDVFIQLFRKIGSFRGDSAFSTWLHRMTVNQVLMHFRKREVKNEFITEDGVVPEVVLVNGQQLSRIPINDRIALEQAIDQLPKGYKQVLVLHDVEGYEHEEIAKILGRSVGTSKSQLHKARSKMQKLLKKKANPRLAVLIERIEKQNEEPEFFLGFDLSQVFREDVSFVEAIELAEMAFADEIPY